MKKKRISIFIIGLLILSNWLGVSAVKAQEVTNTPLNKEEWKAMPLYQGSYVGFDIFGLGSKLMGSDYFSSEISAEINLKNRYFPVVEIGYGQIDTTQEENDIHYKTAAPYFRIGGSYNVFYQKPYLPGQFLVGLRYGFSSFSYDVSAPSMTDPTWGAPTLPFSYEGVKSNASWLEIVIGLKANIYKSIYMGLSLRYRSLMNAKAAKNSEPYYIPGYGKNKGTNIGITYSVVYNLPF